ncbi:hypothetical protein FHETE_7332 [Fusarium heterosporum]|uniref:Uncharacterized protein n=1 Tax=Fusarium heterosporum TaxID=42747 RepID=A0A8H5T5N5_FUSHE|nr:hypothetical protein FHETE_7332 [Fusarium heterosporum]
MPKAPTAGTWVGAPPVTEDGFAFSDGVFFAQASGQNRHRRATATELKEHFTSGSDKDHPAHWFEAQLIHYGLQPSKTKSVARMRLFDAVNAGNIKVPATVSKLETKLKKEWTKNDREVKKGTTSKLPPKTAPTVKEDTKKTATAGSKRKANDDSGVTTKRPKTTTPKPKAPAKTSTKATSKPASKIPTAEAAQAQRKPQTARCVRGGASQGAGRGTNIASQTAKPRLKTTGRCTGPGGASQGPARETGSTGRQMARRGGAWAATGRIPAPSGYDFDDAPLPYSEVLGQDYTSDTNNGGYYDGDDVEGDSVNLAPLGLLNGDYEVISDDVTDQWDFDNDQFELVLTLAGNNLWGRLNLGVYEGVLFFDERPMQSSHDRIWFKWRGREDQGPIIYGNNNHGWMQFLGDGRIEGWLDHQSLSFQAQRLPNQGTRSSIDARSLQGEWNGYSEELYEEESRARWW